MQGAFGVGQLFQTVSKGIGGLLARMEDHMLLFSEEEDKVLLRHKGGDAPGNY